MFYIIQVEMNKSFLDPFPVIFFKSFFWFNLCK